jgi:polyisoprenoid-binding protein YceI
MNKQDFSIDSTHSSVGFSVRHMMFAKVRGRFGAFHGTVHLDPEKLEQSSVEVEIEAKSIDTGTPDRDTHLRSADFFDVEKFPTLTFKSTRIEDLGQGRYAVHGNLSLHGVEREVTLAAEYGGLAKDPWGNQRALFTASGSLDRRDFGLKWNQALEAGGVLVSERVDLELELQAVKAAAAKAAE